MGCFFFQVSASLKDIAGTWAQDGGAMIASEGMDIGVEQEEAGEGTTSKL